MTTSRVAQPGGLGPEPETRLDDADDAPKESRTRSAVAIVARLALLALVVRVFTTLLRTRSTHPDGKKTWPALVPHSVIGVVAAPHSVVHVVSVPDSGRRRARRRRSLAQRTCS